MSIYGNYKLVPNGDKYDVILYLNTRETEFAEEFDKDFVKSEEVYEDINAEVRRKYPNVAINSIKVMLGSVIIATLPFQPITTQAAVSNTTYTVKKGDTLSGIAKRYNTTVTNLKKINRLSRTTLRIGQRLQVPVTYKSVASTPQASSTAPVPSNTSASGSLGNYYTVKKGDTLSGIGRRYSVSVSSLMKANGLKSSIIRVSQRLLIPGTAPPAAAAPAPEMQPVPQPQEVTTPPTVQQNPTAPETQGQIQYTVKAGDSLFLISRSFNIIVDELKRANNLIGDVINVGQRLVIPTAQAAAPIQPQVPETVTPPPAAPWVQPTYYIVKPGDTLSAIAKALNTTVTNIKTENNLTSDTILIGQMLRVPQGASQVGGVSALPSGEVAIDVSVPVGEPVIGSRSLSSIIDLQLGLNLAVFYDPLRLSTGNPWSKASGDQIGFYVNPYNFVNDAYGMYQFLTLNYTAGIDAKDINSLLVGKGVLQGKGEVFLDAANRYNVSQIYLVSHALLETGSGTSRLSKGILVSTVDGKPVEPRVVYNMFGIGAYDVDPDRLGAEYAYKQGWFTTEDAIRGGAQWISANYINNPVYNQNTLYKMRWNPVNPGTHQYSTDIAWAYNQTFNIRKLIELLPDAKLTFDVSR